MKFNFIRNSLLFAISITLPSAFADETCTCKCHEDQPKPVENMILTPCYPEQPKPAVRSHKIIIRKPKQEKQCEVQAPPPEKAQYAPEREIPLVVEERAVPKEQTNGAIYGPGHEVQVIPATGYEVKALKIDEAPPLEEKKPDSIN